MLKRMGLQLQPCRERRCAARVIDLPDPPQKVLLCEGRPLEEEIGVFQPPQDPDDASNIKSTALKTLGFPNSQEIERQPRLFAPKCDLYRTPQPTSSGSEYSWHLDPRQQGRFEKAF
jgi:hypothetical protein